MAVDVPVLTSAWVTFTLQDSTDQWKTYINPDENEEDEEYETEYVTRIVYDPPLREKRMILVSEMPDFFTDSELNTVYHSKQEYVEANDKYGYIYKYMKFDNADTAEKLLNYATDWIKNNYHGGITSLDITAIDMHIMGESVDPYMVGDRIEVRYPDPDTHQIASKTLTCISAEYDLYNPDKTKYKIGIPDITLNKTYGDTAKSGGGGGGGGNSEDENDEDTGTILDMLTDDQTSTEDKVTELLKTCICKILRGEDDTGAGQSTPSNKDPTSPFNFGILSDFLRTGTLQCNSADLGTKIKTAFANITGNADIGGRIWAKGNAIVDGVSTLCGKITGKDGLDLAGGATIKGGATVDDGGLDVKGGATVNDGGLEVKAGGATINDGGLEVKAGGLKTNSLTLNGIEIPKTIELEINGHTYRVAAKLKE